MDSMKRVRILSTILLLFFFLGCANQPQIRQTVPELNTTRSSLKLEDLGKLAKPDRRIVVTVYRFQDKTGQFNDSDKLRYSTAVTQGATSQLITALMRANYFTVVERAHLDDLITEQKLKIEKRVLADTGPEIGKMYGAEYIITGDITEYNVDVITAGAGVRVSGVGGSAQLAVATAAIDLRIVESTTGRIVFNKSLRKSIVGKQVGVNIFRFWDDRLYEINGGIANQEPVQLAIRELLEEGVHMICSSYAKAYEQKKVAKRNISNNKKFVRNHKANSPSRNNQVKTAAKRNNSSRASQTKVASNTPVKKRPSSVKKNTPRKTAPMMTANNKKPAASQKRTVAATSKVKKVPEWAEGLFQATVKDKVVNVRLGPGLEYKKVFQVRKDEVLYVMEKNLVWNLVKTAKGNRGWIRTDKIEITGGPITTMSQEPDIQNISDTERSDDIEKIKKSKNII
jgi:curli biogenesis system outer membrane secretion channel CsgG/SH3-like domain-containing protein